MPTAKPESPKQQHFPRTAVTWIGLRLAEGEVGREAINRHVMEIYATPLEIYCRSLRLSIDPADVVRGFFADRLDRPDFIPGWQRSGLPLRRWLIRATKYFIQEEWARTKRDRRQVDDLVGKPDDPGVVKAWDRAYVISMVSRASRTAQESCEADGHADHWQLFVGHVIHDEAFAALGPRFGVSERRACNMARLARNRFRKELRELLRRDGLPMEDDALDDEIRSIIG